MNFGKIVYGGRVEIAERHRRRLVEQIYEDGTVHLPHVRDDTWYGCGAQFLHISAHKISKMGALALRLRFVLLRNDAGVSSYLHPPKHCGINIGITCKNDVRAPRACKRFPSLSELAHPPGCFSFVCLAVPSLVSDPPPCARQVASGPPCKRTCYSYICPAIFWCGSPCASVHASVQVDIFIHPEVYFLHIILISQTCLRCACMLRSTLELFRWKYAPDAGM